MTTLRINGNRLGDIQDVVGYLQAIEEAYNNLYAFDLIVEDVKKRQIELRKLRGQHSGSRIRGLRRIKRVNEVILPEDRLRLTSIVIQSPGFWDFIGSLNPLEVIRKYLCDRHERKKDEDYRNRLEAEKMALENERLKTKVVEERVNMLRNCGIPEDKINEALIRHVVKPLSKIDAKQDAGYLDNAEFIEKDDSTNKTTDMD